MSVRILLLMGLAVLVTGDYSSVNLVNNGYDGITIAINPTVRESEDLITDIRKAFTSASATLFTATKKRAHFRSINILVPKTWTKRRYPRAVGLSYRKADVIIASANPIKGNNPYTLQTGGCGEPGKYVHFTPEYISDPQENIYGPIEKTIVHEWSHLRWGVFDEYATGNHKRHYIDSNNVLQATRCPLSMSGMNIEYVEPYNESCAINQTSLLPSSDHCHFFPAEEQVRELKTSMMGLSYLPTVYEFCHSDPSDPTNMHNSEADNEQNSRCNLQSTWDVITSTRDFRDGANPPNPSLSNPTPMFRVVSVAPSRRFVLVLDVSESMEGITPWLDRKILYDIAFANRNSRLTMMRQSASAFISTSVSTGDYVGIVEFNDEARILQQLTQITSPSDRDMIKLNIPNLAGGSTCIGCGIQAAVRAMENHNQSESCGHIIVLLDGEEKMSPYIHQVAQDAISMNCTVDAIFFTTTKNEALTSLVRATGGQWFFALDKNLRSLMGAFATIADEDDGDLTNLVSTIAYEQHVLTAGKSQNGKISIDSSVGMNTTFQFAYQIGTPEVQLTAPSGCVYSTAQFTIPAACPGHPLARVDTTLNLVNFVIPGKAEVGSWRYDVTSSFTDTISVFVTSKAEENVLPIIVQTRTRSSTSSVDGPVVIETTVTRGDPGQPILNLAVVAVIEKPDSSIERLSLLDNGAGADTTTNDGVYSRTFTGFTSRGRYSIQVEVNGSLELSGGSTFGSQAPLIFGLVFPNGTITGNPEAEAAIPTVPTDSGQFTRIQTGSGLEFVGEITPPEFDTLAPSQINDLSAAQVDPNNVTSGIRLTFTATGDDADAGTATSYQVCYTFANPSDLSTNFAANICPVVSNQPNAAAVKESIVLPSPDTFNRTGSLRMAIAMTATDEIGNVSPVSNIVLLNFFIEPPIPKCPEAPTESPNGNAPIYSTSPTVVANINYYNNGTTAIYSCQPGSLLASGSTSTMTCNFGRWDATSAPLCEQVCPAAPTSENSLPPTYSNPQITIPGTTGYSPGTRAEYECVVGYAMLSTTTTLTCAEGMWDHNPPQCIQVCERAPVTRNSNPVIYSSQPTMVSGSEKYVIGTKATYTCINQFSLAVNTTNIFTCSSGAWNMVNVPLCLPECGEAPSELPFGREPSYNPESDGMYLLTSYPSGSIATYTCDEDFAFPLGISDTIICNAGVWSAAVAPMCEHVCARAPNASVYGYPPEYNTEVLGDSYRSGTSATYSCDTNYALSLGIPNELICINGLWNSQAAPECIRVCNNPSNNSIPIFNFPSILTGSQTYRNGTTATYSCNVGFAFPVGISDTQTCLNGTWVQPTPPQCARVCAQGPQHLSHGFGPSYNAATVNGRYRTSTLATYSCQEGYAFPRRVRNRIQCRNGEWRPRIPPQCVLVCANPPPPRVNGNRPRFNTRRIFTLGSLHSRSATVARYSCIANHSFAVGTDARLFCHSGIWSSDIAPQCFEMCKNAPDAAMNSVMPLYNPISSTDLYPTGTSATYQCVSGYAFAVGISDNLSCYDGNWYYSTAPKCPKVCKPAPGVRIRGFSPTYNVDVVTSQPTTYRTGTTATYTCPLRFRFRDDVSGVLTCNNGSWNATFAPECEPGIRCMTCTGTTHESCDRSGRNVTCQRNEGQCGVEVRTFEQGEKLVLKYCKQEAACFNDRKQNDLDCRDGFPNSVCRCCCNTHMCSIGNSGCALN